MSADLRDRLKRLGVHTGVSHLKSSRPNAESIGLSSPGAADRNGKTDAAAGFAPAVSADWAEQPLWNIEEATAGGPVFIRRTRYPAQHRHGDRVLASALVLPDLARLSMARDALFLDTETTGLMGGAGTLAFLVGVGYFAKDEGGRMKDEQSDSSFILHPSSFIIDQFFLPDPAYEEGMLCALDRLVAQHSGLVTFNGRGFDVPLLETRYTLARIPPALSDREHLDLLPPSRRIWRNALASCSLGSLEYHLLGVRRDQQDVPGFLIPQFYRDYLQTGQTAGMQRVMYHNAHDILSMVTLASRIADALESPASRAEYLSRAAHYENLGDDAQAEIAYRAALRDEGPEHNAPALRQEAMRRLACCLKRQNRRGDALACWQALADQDDAPALIEMAKHYEWHAIDLPHALDCARRALGAGGHAGVSDDIRYRIARLERKSSRSE